MKRASMVAVVTLGVSVWAPCASAQLLTLGGDDGHNDVYASPQNFALELRGGPYYPNVDNEFSGGVQPFHDIFGDSPRIMTGLEFDWQALRLRYVGTLGLGAGIMYSTFTRAAPQTVNGHSDLTRASGQDTDFTVMPLYAVLVLRVDTLARFTPVPIVPYAKVGLGYTPWWVTSGGALARRNQDSPAADPSVTALANGDLSHAAYGGSLGLHLAAGVMLQLDFLEPRVQRSWDNEMGVNHSYLFVEYTQSNDGSLGGGAQLQVGATTWTTGLALEL